MTVYRYRDGGWESVNAVETPGGSARVLVRRSHGWEEIWPDSAEGLTPVDTLAPSDVGTDSATLRGELRSLDGASNAECWFRYRLAGGEPAVETARQTLAESGTFEVSVDGLSAGADYGGEYDVWGLAAVGGTTYAGRIRTVAIS